jgi:hypothetical protein
LDVNVEDVERKVEVSDREWQDESPWSSNAPPIVLRVPARKLIGWELEQAKEVVVEGWMEDRGLVPLGNDTRYDEPQAKRKGDFVFTPQLPTASNPQVHLGENTEMVTLVPYGCASLRMTIFPMASQWKNRAS